jgi:hypothetical protein
MFTPQLLVVGGYSETSRFLPGEAQHFSSPGARSPDDGNITDLYTAR